MPRRTWRSGVLDTHYCRANDIDQLWIWYEICSFLTNLTISQSKFLRRKYACLQFIMYVLPKYLESLKKEQFELLCRDGTRRNVDEYRNCNWGNVPAHAIVTSSATNQSTRKLYQRFLEKAARILSKKQNMPGNVTDYYNNNNNRFNNRQQGNSYERRTDNNNRFGLNEERDSRYYNDRNDSIYGNPWDNRYNQNYSNGENAPIDSIHSIETFDIFESAPRYGIQRNLLFSVIFKLLVESPKSKLTFVNFPRILLRILYKFERKIKHTSHTWEKDLMLLWLWGSALWNEWNFVLPLTLNWKNALKWRYWKRMTIISRSIWNSTNSTFSDCTESSTAQAGLGVFQRIQSSTLHAVYTRRVINTYIYFQKS